MRAEALSIPGEDPALAATRTAEWNAYYQPQSPAAQQLVNECARATLFSDRLDRFHAAAVTDSMRQAQRDWESQRADEFAQLLELLAKNPSAARDALLNSYGGCCYLIDRWIQLEHRLLDRGVWKPADAAEAVRLLGGLKGSADAWMVRVCSCLIGFKRNTTLLERLFEPDRQPPCFRDTIRLENLPNCSAAFAWLENRVASELTMLRARRDHLNEVERQPGLAHAASLGFVPADPNVARLHLRYLTENRNTFHRAFKSLVTTLKADAERPSTTPRTNLIHPRRHSSIRTELSRPP